MFECCKNCVAPKRHPGCHDHCEEYKTARAAYDEKKAAMDRQHNARAGVLSQKDYAIYKAQRRCRRRKYGGIR